MGLPRYLTLRDFQRATAAFLAISVRRFWSNLRARAGPPFLPPNRPKAKAAGFLPSLAVLPGRVNISTASKAATLVSLDGSLFLLERLRIAKGYA